MDNIGDKNNLIVSRKAISIAFAIAILIGASCFIAGFFWGYRQASADVQASLNKISFTDQINYAASQQFDANGQVVSQISSDVENVVIVPEATAETVSVSEHKEIKEVALEADEASNFKYYAELIGFGHLKTAQAFVEKMQKKGYPVVISKRISKNGVGKTVNWYQAITENFENRAELVKLIDVIKKTERLQDIKIKTIKKN